MLNHSLDTRLLQRVGAQQGSNPAGVFQDEDGQRYYIKNLESEAHARNERIAARLYQLAGAPTLTYVQTQDPCQIATLWLDLDKKSVAHLDYNECLQAQLWFGVHAWSANWDAAGYSGDNQGVIKGRVLTLDVGGALAFRAQGDPKGRYFGTQVEEIDTLRFDENNPHALRLFADMSLEAIHKAIQVVTELSDTHICQAIIQSGGSQKLCAKMLARKTDMVERLTTGRILLKSRQ